MPRSIVRLVPASLALLSAIATPSLAPAQDRNPFEKSEIIKVGDAIHVAPGFGNTFLVTTRDGNVVIDTSNRAAAPTHKRRLQEISKAPVKYIIVTHAHEDHRGGIGVWKEPGTQVIVQEKFEDFLDYSARLGPFFARRNRAQFAGGVAGELQAGAGTLAALLDRRPATAPERKEAPAVRGGAVVDSLAVDRAPSGATIHFDDKYTFDLGGLTFEVYSTPGETYDALSVWIPQHRTAFIGDNFYKSFPNIYTLRGTRPRWALDYIRSLDKVLSWRPEVVLPSHGEPIRGEEEVRRQLTRYRDAIRYVHDATVQGLNDGKDVFTLMREIKLPKELEVGEGYGNLPWSIRGIYEGYVGWFDANPSTMYSVPPKAVYGDLVQAAGVKPLLDRAEARLKAAEPVHALHLADVVLESDPSNREALGIRIRALESLIEKSRNSNERGWLNDGLRRTREKLGR